MERELSRPGGGVSEKDMIAPPTKGIRGLIGRKNCQSAKMANEIRNRSLNIGLSLDAT
jgi:hypothetical protein